MADVTGPQALNAMSKVSPPTGTDDVFLSLLGKDAGGAPDFIARDWWKWVTITGNGHTLRILVAPDYLALGDDGTEFPVARVTPYAAQKAAQRLNAILPSRKLVDAIELASAPHIPYLDVKGPPFKIPIGKIETPEATSAMADMRRKAFALYGIDSGDTPDAFDKPVIGYRKTIVVGPDLDGSRVAIYGGRYAPAPGTPWTLSSAARVQPYSTFHTFDYADYSHGIVLVSRKAELDGHPVDLRTDVFGSSDPKVWGLVSDQGRFDPVFPNAGSKSIGAFRGTTPVPPGTSVVSKDGVVTPPGASAAGSGSSSILKLFGVTIVAGLVVRWIFG